MPQLLVHPSLSTILSVQKLHGGKFALTQELSKLLEIADYGMQYRAVSHVGAVLGSSRDTGTKSADPNDPTVPKEQVPPRWLENWRNRRAKAAQKRESNEKGKESEVILDGNRDN